MSHRIQQASNGEYLLYFDDKQHGPFSAAQVRGLYLDGAIHDDTPAAQAGMAEWQPLKTVLPDLAQAAAPQPAPIQNPLPTRNRPQGGLSRQAALALVGVALVFVAIGVAGVIWGLRQRVAEPPTDKQSTTQTDNRSDAVPLTNPPATTDERLVNTQPSARPATNGTEAKGDPNSRFLETKAKATKGDAQAQYELGKCYDDGLGVPRDAAEAAKWFKMAAEQNIAPAQNTLANLYSLGIGVPQSQAEALKWFQRAANQGFASAQNALGICFAFGNGLPKDHATAVNWFRKAAEQNFAEAQQNLGISYYNGQGVARDYAEAVKWYRKAAECNFATAQNNLGICYYNGEGVPKDFVEAYAWLNLAARKNTGSAQVRNLLEKQMSPPQITAGQARSKQLEAQIAAKLAERPLLSK